MTPPLYPRSILCGTLLGVALLLIVGGCSGGGGSAPQGKSLDPLAQPTIAKLKPRSKAGNTPATASLPKDTPEDPAPPAKDGDESVSRAAAGLQKVLGKADPRAEASDVPAGFTLPANPRARTKPNTPAPKREPKVYPAPPPPVNEAEPMELHPTTPAPGGIDAQAGSTTDAALFPPSVPAPVTQPVAPALVPVIPQPKAAPTPVPVGNWPTTFAMPTAALCSRVESFGRFTALPPGSIQPGRATPVLLYTEFEGFQHRTASGLPAPTMMEPDGKESDTEWIVEIEQEVTLYDANGLQGMHVDPQAARDTAKRRRRDHFLIQRLTIPSLPPGQYTLKIIARDRANYGYTIETNVPITVGSGRSGH